MAWIPMTLSEIEGHFCWTTDKVCRAVPLQQQSFLLGIVVYILSIPTFLF